MKIDRVEVEPVRPTGNAKRKKRAPEHRGIAEWFDHRAAFRQNVREIAHALLPVGKAQPERAIADNFQSDDFYDLDHGWSAPGMASNGSLSLARSQFDSNS